MLVDAETRLITYVNPRVESMIGLPKEKIIGQLCHQFVCTAQVNECPVIDLGMKIDNAERVL